MTSRLHVAALLANGSRIKQYGVGAFLLLGANLVSGVSLALISSGRLTFIDSEIANFIVIFIQWQVFALTVAKFGIDQVVFAAVSADRTLVFDATRHITRRVLPASVLFAIIIGALFSPWAALGLLFSLPVDAYSVMRIADLNARKKFPQAASASLFNYPVFLLLVLIVGLTVGLNTAWVIVLFISSSLTRAAYLWLISRRNPADASSYRRVDSDVSTPMVLQQAMNYWMFRSDVLLLSLAGSAGISALEIQKYLFLSRFCDFVAVLVTSLGPVFLPLLFVKYPYGVGGTRSRLRQTLFYVGMVVAMFVLIVPASLIYRELWSTGRISWEEFLPFLVVSALILLPNIVTYSMLRQGYLQGLLRNQTLAVFCGALWVVAVILLFTAGLAYLPTMIIIQLGGFTALSVLLAWGRQRDLVLS